MISKIRFLKYDLKSLKSSQIPKIPVIREIRPKSLQTGLKTYAKFPRKIPEILEIRSKIPEIWSRIFQIRPEILKARNPRDPNLNR